MEHIQFKRWTRIPDYNNPAEMTTGLLSFDDEACKRCGICCFICPARSITRETGPDAWRNGLPRLSSVLPGITNCVACGCCAAACPENAIHITRQFNPGYFYKRLTQTPTLTYPKCYTADDLPPEYFSEKKESGSPTQPGGAEKTGKRPTWEQKRQQFRLLKRAAGALARLTLEDIRQGWFFKTIAARRKGTTADISWAELLEARAKQMPSKRFLLYRDETYTYREMDENANRVAGLLLKHGGGRGKGLGIFMRNSPRVLDLFFGAQKIGMYLVPINPELKGDGLAYLINHSDMEYLAVDAELLGSLRAVHGRLERVKTVIVDDVEKEAEGIDLPGEMILLSAAYALPPDNPGVGYNPDDICLIIYTSGTTGPPKGVVYRYRSSSVKRLMFFAYVLLEKNDVYYTCLPLCHGNALFITTSMTLARGAAMALSRKFSASRFWDEVRACHATVFNTIGSIIPILMKQPEKETDLKNEVRFVFSAACPAEMWEPFERRFGLKLYEGYGAVDGGGKGLMNLQTGPVGSMGKPTSPKSIKIVDENDRPVPVGVPGELAFAVREGRRVVEYYKNEKASDEKIRAGWLYTGDLVRQDENGFVYFVGRNTESMRKGGENVSAYEVEHAIMGHPAVEDVAVYAVPSEMSEDEIMAAIKTVEGKSVTADEIRNFLAERLAKYAVPRYIRFVSDFPKTTSHRIIKRVLEQEGITEDTDDAQRRR